MRRTALVAACAGLLVIACRSSSPDAKSVVSPDATSGAPTAPTGTPARMPARHRAVAVACPAAVPPPGYTAPRPGPARGGNACNNDADCKGTNARCVLGRRGNTYCTSDLCTKDADCPGGKVCECDAGNNQCLPSGCRTDSDCGSFACSPTHASSCLSMGGGPVGYYCHGAKDECVDDADCGGADKGMCVYAPTVSHWKCSHEYCVG